MMGRSTIVGVGLLRVCCIERGKCMGARCQLRYIHEYIHVVQRARVQYCSVTAKRKGRRRLRKDCVLQRIGKEGGS